MNSDTLKELALQASYPRGIAARIDSADLAQLLGERTALLAVVVRYVESCDPCIRENERQPDCECVACGTTRDGERAIELAEAD